MQISQNHSANRVKNVQNHHLLSDNEKSNARNEITFELDGMITCVCKN